MKKETKQDIVKRLQEGLNAQQRSVPQLPAQAHAKKIKALGSKTDPKHPFSGYMVGADESAEPGSKRLGPDKNDPYEQGWRAGFRPNEFNPYPAGSKEAKQWDNGYEEARSQPNHYDEAVEEVKLDEKCWDGYKKKGMKTMFGKRVVPHCVKNEAAERNELDDPRVQAALKKMAERHKNEKWSKEQLAALGKRLASRGQKAVKVDEAIANEDVLSALKTKLGDLLLQTLGKQAVDGDLKDKPNSQDDKEISPVVKKIKTDDGHEICIHGNEDDGFRVSVKGKEGTTKFESLEHAEIASKMYCARRRAKNSDFLDEA